MIPFSLGRRVLVGSLATLAGLVAQSNVGQLHGKVTDTSGAALPETDVEIRRAAGGERRTVTDAKGDVTVAAGSVTTITFALEVAGVAETVTVTGETPIVDVQAVAGGVGGGRSIGLRWGVAGSPFNTEAYDKIDDNQWTAVGRKPLSTFSIDVDTASYPTSGLRRFGLAVQLGLVHCAHVAKTGQHMRKDTSRS